MEEDKAERGDTKADFIALDSMTLEGDDEHGSRMHPGSITHARACKKLVEEIQKRI